MKTWKTNRLMRKQRQQAANSLQAAGEPSSLRICGAGEALQLEAAEQAGDGKPKLRRFSMVAYTGAAMPVGFAWPVVVDLAGMNVPSQGRPILRDHDSTAIVGHTDSIEVSAQRIKVAGVMSGVGEQAQEVLALAANGFPWQASIGASIERLEFVDRGETVKVNGRSFQGPVYVARATTLREVSFVASGADGNTSASVAAGRTGDQTMTFEQWLQAKGFDPATLTDAQRTALQAAYRAEHPASPSAAPVNPAPAAPANPQPSAADVQAEAERQIQARRQREAAEEQRVADIRRLTAQHNNPNIAIGQGDQRREVALAAHAIAEGWDTQRVELEILRASRQSPAVIVRSHDRDCTLEALQGAMVLRAGGRLDHPCYQSPAAIAIGVPSWLRAGINAEQRQRAMEAAHRYADMSAVDICRESVRLDGRDCPQNRRDIIRAAFSGSALTNIFTTNVNATLLATYMEAGDTTGGWTSSVDVADFKTNERPRLGKGPNLAKLPRGGEADHYSRSDSVESYKIARYAKQFVIDEQDMIDDALGAFADTPREMGLAAARLRPDLVYAILLRNAALGADSIALFHASHSNLNTTAALASAKLIAAIAALEKQRENGVNLNLKATHLIVPSDLKHTGAELINSSQILLGADDESVRGNMNTINAIETLTLVSDARLSNGVTDPVDGTSQSGSTSTWYLASSMGHNIEVGYLRGTGRAPQVRSFVLTQGQWGMGWDINMDIGAKALDYHGMQKNTA